MKGLLIAAQVENLSTRKDHTIKITLGAQELSPAIGSQLLSLMNQVCSVYISPSEIDGKEIKQIDSLEPDMPSKSPSQRMRNVLYILYTQGNEGFKEFDSYYRHKMENFIDELKKNIQ
jgi:hypothetical protein